jgi:hypothetical protein
MLARFLLLAIATLAGAAAQQTAPHASPLIGRWVVRADNGDGTFRETVFVFEQNGQSLSGRIINPTNEQPMIDGAVDGDAATFAIVAGRPSNQRRMEYRAARAGSSLAITVKRT